MSYVIKVDGLGKKYIIRHRTQGRYSTLRDTFTQSLNIFMGRVTNKNNNTFGPSSEEFWALKDISFEVKQGERVGIIGRNGAGKSTLLKILSRITGPTRGCVRIRGRVASLLEVGTGFHPELSGRENVYLNGAILGMTRSEIKRKFDEIVDFAEIEKFLDTPVKRYSSGMYVRLAFAVAAHLEPEILLVDEVLAVGDAAFQQKCLGKMDEVAKEGRTVLFISHNMEAISTLCQYGMVLSNGSSIYNGLAQLAIEKYFLNLSNDMELQGADILFPNEPEKQGQIHRVQMLNQSADLTTRHDLMSPITIAIDFELRQAFDNLIIACQIRRNNGSLIYSTGEMDWYNYNSQTMKDIFPKAVGSYHASVKLPAPLLNSGVYELLVALSVPRIDCPDIRRGIIFEVTDSQSFASYPFKERREGLLAIPVQWEVLKKI